MFLEFDTNCLASGEKAIKSLLKSNKQDIVALLKEKNKKYANFVRPYMELSAKVEYLSTMIYHLDGVYNSKLSQKVVNQIDPLLTAYGSEIQQNEKIFDAFKFIYKNEKKSLTKEQKKVCELEIRDFKLSGCGLSDELKNRLKEISLKLSELSISFSQNLLDATNAFEMIIENKDDVKNIPQSDLLAAKFVENNMTKYKFTLKMPSYIAYMTYGTNRTLREKLYQAYSTRAPQNGDLIDEILKLKSEKSEILGFENYAELSLATKTARTTDEVLDFLYLLGEKSKNRANAELEEVTELAKLDGIDKLESFDMAFYSQILKEKKYSIKEEDYKPYFEKNSVMKGLFSFLKKTFGLKFIEVSTPTWHKSVNVYDIYEKNILKSRIYVDLETRKEKKGGAWMNSWVSAYEKADGSHSLPVAFIVGNFAPASKTEPSLLRHDDVVTIFHEMGHALHHLVSQQKELFVSGINGVAWDVVEFPSQFLEYFAYEKQVLKMFAKHYKTKEVLSDEMIQRLINAKNFQSAISTLRQLEFAIFDFRLYKSPVFGEDIDKLLNEIRDEISIIKPPIYNKFQNGFSHIFSGGYAAGYYSYKWAEVLSADAFLLFIDNGVMNKRLANSYKKYILGKGGSANMSDLYKKFAKREPKVESLLKIDGII